jgi:hypothetical protein
MRKVFVLALLFLVVLPAKTEGLGPSPANAAECTWQRHSKRVVKRVHRHGKVGKVVRRRHWWSCVPRAEAVPSPVPAALPVAAPEPEAEPEANRVSVKGAEYYFVLSRPSVKPGEVTVELNNQGEDPHNLNLRLEEATRSRCRSRKRTRYSAQSRPSTCRAANTASGARSQNMKNAGCRPP